MKRIFFLSFFLSICFLASAQETEKKIVEAVDLKKVENQAKNVEGAFMHFKSTKVDFGTIEQDSDPYRTISFTNTGSEPLLITNAKGSCGCTVPTYPKEAIAPGESGEIKIRYATNRLGGINKTVTITTNSSQGPIKLSVVGKVLKKPEEPAGVPEGEKNMFKSGNNN